MKGQVYEIATTLVVEEKEFVAPDGNVVPYMSVVAEIEGAEIHFSVKKSDQALFKHVLKK